MLGGFLGQLQRDFEVICAADFSETATVTDFDGVTTITIPCIFDEAVAQFDPDTQSRILAPQPRMTVAETATDFNLRRGGLLVSVRGKNYKVRPSDWDFDGLGQLVLYLDPAP